MPVEKCVIRIKIAIFAFAMKIIENSQNFFDLLPLEVCFLVTPWIKAEYGATLESLNNKPEFTKGVLTFRVLMRSDVNIDSVMPDELKEAFYGNNMVMRLPDDEDGNCIYAFENIDFTLSPSIPVMPFNYNYSSDGTLRAGFLTSGGISAINKDYSERARRKGQSEESIRIALEIFWEMFGSRDSTINRPIYANKASIPPENPPKSKFVEVRKVVTRVLKNGHKKEEWGVVFNVDGIESSVYLGSKDMTMLYICTLIGKKYGWKVSNQTFSDEGSIMWLGKVYQVLYKYKGREFDDWIKTMQIDTSDRCKNAKSQVNNLIWGSIPDNAFYYFTLTAYKEGRSISSYNIRIEPENIFLPPELSNLKGEILE